MKAVKIKNAILNRAYGLYVRLRLRLNHVVFGKGLFVMNSIPSLEIGKFRRFIIGERFTINGSNNAAAWYCKSAITVEDNAELTIGNDVGMNGSLIYCRKQITIGDNSIIGGGTRIFDTDFHSIDYSVRQDKKRFNESKSLPIRIGNDVFIGSNCIICKGVTIGDHSVIGAGSVVTKDIPSDCIAAGNPCKKIKYINQ